MRSFASEPAKEGRRLCRLRQSPVSVLHEKKERLISRFLKGDEPCFLERHAEILDDYFRESFARSSVGPRIRVDKNPYAIIALGGYGRKEQCLHSDVDVLLLFKRKIPDETKEIINEIFYPLWDIGLDVGYATRTLKECTKLAGQDFEVLTSLLDARFLCGISSLWSDLMEQVHGKVLYRYGRAYIEWLAERNQRRHARFGDSSYLLEPNLKEGLGGLRDYHSIIWAARTKYDLKEPKELEVAGHLSHSEFHTLTEALSFIWGVRNWLHHLSKRRCDQLYFEYQVQLTRVLGFKEKNSRQAVETFLGMLHGHMAFLKQQHLLFLDRVIPRKRRPRRGKDVRRTVAKGIEIVQDTLHFESSEAILQDPRLLIQIFERGANLGIPLSIEARRLIKEFLYLIDEDFQRSRVVVRSFQHILLAPYRHFSVLNDMLNTGIMAAFIPEIKGIVHRIQYDAYHLYPVDKHSLRTVQILKGFGDQAQDTLCRELFLEIGRPELLLWAALLHDVGKGEQGEDHARRGADMVRSILERMGFAEYAIDTISFLVREHLLLMNTATRRDLNDEKTVVQCARKIREIEYLKMLYLLSVADSMATGPKAWNDWIAVLLKELFFKVYHILKARKLATPAAIDIVEKKRKDVLEGAVSMSPKVVETLFDQMSPRYLLYTSSKDILRHIDLYQGLGDAPFVLEFQPVPGTNYRTATICAGDFPGLFSKIAGVLTLNNLDILSAQIYTWRNHIALDIFKVKAPPDTLLENDVWAQVKNDLRSALKGALAIGPLLDQKWIAYQSLQKQIQERPDHIVVDNRTSDFFTIIEIYTHNFPGLLYRITDTLFQYKLDTWVAKIATKVDQVVDVFYVRDFDGQKVNAPEQIAAIKEAIMEILTTGSMRSRKLSSCTHIGGHRG